VARAPRPRGLRALKRRPRFGFEGKPRTRPCGRGARSHTSLGLRIEEPGLDHSSMTARISTADPQRNDRRLRSAVNCFGSGKAATKASSFRARPNWSRSPLQNSLAWCKFAESPDRKARSSTGVTGVPRPIRPTTRSSPPAARKPTAAPKENPQNTRRQVEFPRQPIEPGANVVNFALAIVVFTLTQTRTAKVKAKDGPAKTCSAFAA